MELHFRESQKLAYKEQLKESPLPFPFSLSLLSRGTKKPAKKTAEHHNKFNCNHVTLQLNMQKHYSLLNKLPGRTQN